MVDSSTNGWLTLDERRQGTRQLRKAWKEQNRQQTVTKKGQIYRELKMKAAFRYHKNGAELSDNRISERESQFLQDKEERCARNLSTPKYFTRLNTRAALPKIDPTTLHSDNFKTLTSSRLDIPTYQVPTNLPELCQIRSLLNSAESKTSPVSHQSKTASSDKPSLELKDWVDLLTRPTVARPEFAEPIRCKTPGLKLTDPDYQKPTKGLFKTINKTTITRDFTVHPEFVSEMVRIPYIPGQSSNPLKYGWA